MQKSRILRYDYAVPLGGSFTRIQNEFLMSYIFQRKSILLYRTFKREEGVPIRSRIYMYYMFQVNLLYAIFFPGLLQYKNK